MASQSFFDVEHANRDVKIVSGRIDVGSSGAPTIKFGLGFSIARVSAALYELTLDKSYTGLVDVSACHFNLTGGSDEFRFVVTAEDVSTATPNVRLNAINTAGSSTTDIPDGDDFSFTLVLLDGEVS